MSAFCADYRVSLPILVAGKTLVVFHGAVYTCIGVKVIIVRFIAYTYLQFINRIRVSPAIKLLTVCYTLR